MTHILLSFLSSLSPADHLITQHIPGGPGDLGDGFRAPESNDSWVQKLIERGKARNAFNQYVSDQISLQRELKDYRDEW